MTDLKAVDRVEIRVLVDNVTDNLSSVPSFVETEIASLDRRWANRWIMSGACLCCGAHGLSCLVTIHSGGEKRTVLFDSGPDEQVFEQNVSRLGVDLGVVDAVVLSHGHWDHAGAMLRALRIIRHGNGGRLVPYYAHPGMFRTRAMRRPDGSMRPMQDVPGVGVLTEHGAEVVLATEPTAIAGGFACVSGEIPRVTPFESGLPGQHRRTEDGSGWEPDELLMDERFLAVNVAGKGLVVLSACSHAGIVNVMTEARKRFPGVPLHCVMGGLHLSGTNERVIPETVAAMKEFGPEVVAAGHCTGWRAMSALATAFGDRVLAPLAVGKGYAF
ncbi:MAG: MBL fold metallo-hydrolase [Hyphomicrobiaceae bacterium]